MTPLDKDLKIEELKNTTTLLIQRIEKMEQDLQVLMRRPPMNAMNGGGPVYGQRPDMGTYQQPMQNMGCRPVPEPWLGMGDQPSGMRGFQHTMGGPNQRSSDYQPNFGYPPPQPAPGVSMYSVARIDMDGVVLEREAYIHHPDLPLKVTVNHAVLVAVLAKGFKPDKQLDVSHGHIKLSFAHKTVESDRDCILKTLGLISAMFKVEYQFTNEDLLMALDKITVERAAVEYQES